MIDVYTEIALGNDKIIKNINTLKNYRYIFGSLVELGFGDFFPQCLEEARFDFDYSHEYDDEGGTFISTNFYLNGGVFNQNLSQFIILREKPRHSCRGGIAQLFCVKPLH